MSITRPFAFNSGSTISGSVKFGSLSVGAASIMDFSTNPGNAQWWMGPDEDLGYIIAVPDPTFSQSSAAGPNAGVRFWRSNGKTDAEFLSLSNVVARRLDQSPFNTISDALSWLVTSGFPTTYPQVNYDSDVLTYISGLTTPLSFVQLNLVNTFIVNLKSGLGITNLSDAFDVLYILANETLEAAVRNLVSRNYDCTTVNSPTFTAFEGIAGDGLSSFTNTNFNGNGGVNYTLNNAALGVYSRTNLTGSYVDIGCRYASTQYANILSRYATGTNTRLHNSSNTYATHSTSDSLGMCMVTRNGNLPTNIYAYKNKNSSTGTGTDNSSNIPNYTFYIGARNAAGTAEYFSARQLSFAFCSKYISTSERDIIVDTFESYMDNLGKGVIT